MLSMNDLKVGYIIKYQGEPYQILKANHLKMGRGGAVLQTKFKGLKNGKTLQKTFRSADKFEPAEIISKKADYLYSQENKSYFMDENYEQFFIPTEQIKKQLYFIPEGQSTAILYFENSPFALDLPSKVELEVTQAPPAVKGDTSQGSGTKDITLETGFQIIAPIFIKPNDIVRINTETGEYVERVNN